jgi:hypothetical protein
MWGTWWEWDPRLTSFLILFLFYLGYMALWEAVENPDAAADLTAVLCLVGSVFAVISRYALVFWNQGLHQGATLSRSMPNRTSRMSSGTRSITALAWASDSCSWRSSSTAPGPRSAPAVSRPSSRRNGWPDAGFGPIRDRGPLGLRRDHRAPCRNRDPVHLEGAAHTGQAGRTWKHGAERAHEIQLADGSALRALSRGSRASGCGNCKTTSSPCNRAWTPRR